MRAMCYVMQPNSKNPILSLFLMRVREGTLNEQDIKAVERILAKAKIVAERRFKRRTRKKLRKQ
jgi:hypothetical protein